MKAVILAGGFGTRLRPISCTRPKTLFPIVNKPLLEGIFERLSKNSFTEAIMAVKKEAVQAKVEAGILTQEQADLMLQQMEQRTQQAVNRTSVGPPDWSRGNGRGACSGETGLGSGPGGMHRWGRGSR